MSSLRNKNTILCVTSVKPKKEENNLDSYNWITQNPGIWWEIKLPLILLKKKRRKREDEIKMSKEQWAA